MHGERDSRDDEGEQVRRMGRESKKGREAGRKGGRQGGRKERRKNLKGRREWGRKGSCDSKAAGRASQLCALWHSSCSTPVDRQGGWLEACQGPSRPATAEPTGELSHSSGPLPPNFLIAETRSGTGKP